MIEFHSFDELGFGHALFERVRHVNGAGSDEKGFAPLAVECGDIGGESDDGGRDAIHRTQADGGNFDDLAQLGTAGRGALEAWVSVESPTRRIMISARASSAITLGARPPERVPMLSVLGPSSGSSGSGIRRISARASSSLLTAESPSSG